MASPGLKEQATTSALTNTGLEGETLQSARAPLRPSWRRVVDVVNRACIFPFGGTLGICTWSNEVTNSAFRPYRIYLPIALRNY
jgi:hypothetical protein